MTRQESGSGGGMIDTTSNELPDDGESEGDGARRLRLHVEEGGIGVLTLCRPEKLNAWSWESSRQLGLLADRIRFDDTIRVVLLRAEGRAFCAGTTSRRPAAGSPGAQGPSGRATTTRASAGSMNGSARSPACRSPSSRPCRATASVSGSSWR
ncbi:enoyl-CoA hydratase/isomerase family protein [Streptomyces sp. NPDC058066]|uniref:enoyl-CoA hydratase/isomerase family protein n=1 Tax=Streptomyces sp. NPDC058066 TaxID=3346323 RepID=UPI0036E1B78A